jgi:UDP-N-acetylglucosamine--N-acetylmuramyl-(pentapeptide) pyrophosphoryl-undecaprenol N-acetylglucosamine transferase
LHDLLVASAGGHLQQLRMLSGRITEPGSGRLWISYNVPQVQSLLAGEQIIFAAHPTTKHIPNAIRNYWLARRVLAEHGITRVVSTGAAIAVPFMIQARRLGIPCHYIESATRVEGPSLSGSILQRFQGVKLYRQMGTWGQPAWEDGPCVFDGFWVVEGPTARLERIAVSLGTHRFPYEALILKLASCLQQTQAEVFWQLGSTRPTPNLPGQVERHVTADRLQSTFAKADVVVGHAGVGLALSALLVGRVPVLVPRRRSRGEHTDDHQVEFARELDRRGLAVTAEVGELTVEHLERAAHLGAELREPERFALGP